MSISFLLSYNISKERGDDMKLIYEPEYMQLGLKIAYYRKLRGKKAADIIGGFLCLCFASIQKAILVVRVYHADRLQIRIYNDRADKRHTSHFQIL